MICKCIVVFPYFKKKELVIIISRKLTGKRQSLPYYGRVDTLLEQMHDTLRDFNQTH